MSPETFQTILLANPKFEAGDDSYIRIIKEVYPQIEKEIFAFERPYKNLGYPFKNGTTGYFGRNLNKTELDLIKEFLKNQKIEILNTRAFKKGEGSYIITIGSQD